MLFTSYEFLFAFFPMTVAVYFTVGRGIVARTAILLLASLAFYAWWNWSFLALLLGSICANYGLGAFIQRAMAGGRNRQAKWTVMAGIFLNVATLGLFKFSGFAVENFNALTGTDIVISHIVLPLGISFFTFEQIGFLVDIGRGAPYRLEPLRFAVFVSFFPRLVAGPILRYDEIVPQLEQDVQGRNQRIYDLAIGLSFFSIGLAKKAFLADGIAPFVALPFDAAAAGQPVDLLVAWAGALAYTAQLYFDFSGYSDMAIGAARCFGVRFPENFNSPYKSGSIIEFWRRWHITLSRFLRDYVYISLGGNRLGETRRYLNLLATMLIGGFWHGANWTFVVWGALHGLYLIINHAWVAVAARHRFLTVVRASLLGRASGFLLTFVAVVVAWVFFRAQTLDAALHVLTAMTGRNGALLPAAIMTYLQPLAPLFAALDIGSGGSGMRFASTWLWIGALFPIAFFAPNTQEIVAKVQASLLAQHKGQWARQAWAIAMGAAAFIGLLSVNRANAFLYWQF